MKYLFLSIAVFLLLLLGGLGARAAKKAATTPVRTNDDAILHAWCWPFNTIRANMKDIAAAGFAYVQTSPANKCFVGEDGGMEIYGKGKWYYHYQPIDWRIGNYQLGTRDEFKAMCDEAHRYGVKVLVDVLPNHTAVDTSAVTQELRDAVGGLDNLYHANGFREITDYNNREQCTTWAMGGLPDVNTENPDFQHYYMLYVNDLIACGADGFRYDTAKHIGLPTDPLDPKAKENDFWDVATGRKSVKGVRLDTRKDLFIYGEVLQDKNVKEKEYAEYVNLTASNYGHAIRTIIGNRKAKPTEVRNYLHPVDPYKLTTWVESHDTYCNAHESAGLTDTQIRLGWVIIAARQNGTPLFYSRPEGSTRENYWGNNRIGERGNGEFKHPEVVAVNKFRRAMHGEREHIAVNKAGNVVEICRGKAGAAIVNLSLQPVVLSMPTKLPDGSYTDQVHGTEFTVSKGKITATLSPETSYILLRK